jgi:hypothetical protein
MLNVLLQPAATRQQLTAAQQPASSRRTPDRRHLGSRPAAHAARLQSGTGTGQQLCQTAAYGSPGSPGQSRDTPLQIGTATALYLSQAVGAQVACPGHSACTALKL